MKRPIYFDYMASTPMDPEVIATLNDAMHNPMLIGNPASHAHAYGWQAREAIAKATREVADLIQAKPEAITWTSGATESINLAIKGAMAHYHRQGRHIITLATEHEATLDTCRQLENKGIEVTYLKPKKDGLINLEALKAAFKPTTVLVSICHINNEIGVIQDLASIANITHEQGALLHVDAAQTLGKAPLNFTDNHIDFASLSAHKVYGPKGIGALAVCTNPKRRLTPQLHGGSQQPFRSGTLPTHLIMAFGKACALAQKHFSNEIKQIQSWHNTCIHALTQCQGVALTGHPTARAPHNIHITVEKVHGESLMLALNQIAISSGSACNSASPKPSHVLTALGYPRQLSLNAFRISMGRFTTQQDIDFLCQYFPKTLNKLRAIAP